MSEIKNKKDHARQLSHFRFFMNHNDKTISNLGSKLVFHRLEILIIGRQRVKAMKTVKRIFDMKFELFPLIDTFMKI